MHLSDLQSSTERQICRQLTLILYKIVRAMMNTVNWFTNPFSNNWGLESLETFPVSHSVVSGEAVILTQVWLPPKFTDLASMITIIVPTNYVPGTK